MMCSKWRGLCGILSLAGSLTLLGCGVKGNSYVRVVNASPGLSNFTVVAGQTPLVSSIPFGTEGIQQQGQYTTADTSGNYRPLGAGNGQKLYVYGTAPSNILTSTTQSFIKSTAYTIVSVGAAPNIMLQTLTDDNTAPASGNYSLRVMDTSTMAGYVDVYITAVGAGVGGSPVVGNMQFQQITIPYLQLSPGTLEVQVTPAGNPSKVLAIQPFS
ncbi:MAG TPA: DUF4397 domain-containing protein, partial [Acidobacteriaceae bacterium]|nr:DUF4397 domain-containing protein [Acidobacteriaceae bacterium]